uniref:Vang-like protein n=1 Tax=Macrostomum lignano TaxID=282301 RepID=A0A1I8I2D5_9PLAT
DADSGIGAASSCSCARASTVGLSAALGVAAFASPPLMLALPRSGAFAAWPLGECGVACEGQLLGLAFRLLALLVAAWCLFFRRARASLPAAFLLCLLFAIIAVFWAFYALRIVRQRERDYDTVVQFAVALADALLFLHYLGVVLLEIRHLQCRFSVKVLRSPDGEARLYTLGETSVQRAAVHVLQRYCVDFSAFNPHLHSMLTMSGGGGSGARNTRRYKFYELDRASSAASGHSRGQSRAEGGPSSAAERFQYPPAKYFTSSATPRQFECDFERRLRKRRARLVSAADEAFAHIGRTAQHRSDQSAGAAISRQMEASEAAQAVFPTLLRPLQRYLRVTRQQPRYSMDAVLQHLAACIRHGLGPRAFIERYLGQGRVVEDPRSGTAGQVRTGSKIPTRLHYVLIVCV